MPADGIVTVSDLKSMTIQSICLQYNQFTPQMEQLANGGSFYALHLLIWHFI
jgi:hypothetical protein